MAAEARATVSVAEPPPPVQATSAGRKFAAAISRVSLLLQDGWDDALAASGGAVERCIPAVLFAVRQLVSNKHVPQKLERQSAINVLIDAFRRAGHELSEAGRDLLVTLVDDIADSLRATRARDWKPRG